MMLHAIPELFISLKFTKWKIFSSRTFSILILIFSILFFSLSSYRVDLVSKWQPAAKDFSLFYQHVLHFQLKPYFSFVMATFPTDFNFSFLFLLWWSYAAHFIHTADVVQKFASQSENQNEMTRFIFFKNFRHTQNKLLEIIIQFVCYSHFNELNAAFHPYTLHNAMTTREKEKLFVVRHECTSWIRRK